MMQTKNKYLQKKTVQSQRHPSRLPSYSYTADVLNCLETVNRLHRRGGIFASNCRLIYFRFECKRRIVSIGNEIQIQMDEAIYKITVILIIIYAFIAHVVEFHTI